MAEKDTVSAVCGKLHDLSRIPLAVCDDVGRYLSVWPSFPLDTILPQVAAYLPMDFVMQRRDEWHPLILYQEPGYFTGIVRLHETRYCLVGPVGPITHSRQEVLSFCAPAVSPARLQEYCAVLMHTPLVTLPQMKALLCLLVQMVHGRAIEPEDVLFCDNTALQPHDGRALQQMLFQNREEMLAHIPADFEQAICDAVAQGSLDSLSSHLILPSVGQNGKMSDNNLRQQKYTFVSFITLVTRAAVRGGLPAEAAYSLSDVYCQRMDAMTDPERINRLLYTSALDFCQRVKEARDGAGRSGLTQKCLEYITVHLHEPISLQILADHCGVCVRTLTARFRQETGMSLNAYIHRERIREACYLLAHTAYPLADIAFFLHYPSQSYFTQVFRRYQGCTPQQYRQHPGRYAVL